MDNNKKAVAENGLPNTVLPPSCPPGYSFPRSALSVSREQFYGQDEDHQPLKLTVKKGMTEEEVVLPAELGLYGSVFIVGPAGNAASPLAPSPSSNGDRVVLPSKDGWTPTLAGDGMVYRLDFETNGDTCQAYFANRIVETPSIIADRLTSEATENGVSNPYHKFRFDNLGILRFSPFCGTSNALNTAFLPMLFPNQDCTRLLVTWDVGRPFEIDPNSLALLAPVGLNKDWDSMVPGAGFLPFPENMSSAHPCFDPNDGQMFTVNVVKSLNTLTLFNRLFRHLLGTSTGKVWAIFALFVKIVAGILFVLGWLAEQIIELLGKGFGLSGNQTYIVKWDGKNPPKKWKLLDKGLPVKISSTSHQMGLTKDYIVIANTVFKVALEETLPILRKLRESIPGFNLEQYLKLSGNCYKNLIDFYRGLLTFPQDRTVMLHIIDRRDIDRAEREGKDEVPVKSVEIGSEFTHFLTDYDNPDNKIAIHTAVLTATDSAEFIHAQDISPFPDGNCKDYAGLLTNGMAVNQNGIHIIDGETGTVEREGYLSLEQAKQNAWYVGLFAYREDFPTRKFTDLYWLSLGAWKELQTEFVYDLYKDVGNRSPKELEELMEIVRKGVPSILYRVRVDRESSSMLTVLDSYSAPCKYFLSSPQFVPRQDSEGSTDGYIICTAIYSHRFLSNASGSSNWSDNSELWIFDAGNLHQGPLYRLSHPHINFTLTIHTVWVRDRAPVPKPEYNVREDFQDLVKKRASLFANPENKHHFLSLFDKIYEEFDRNRESN